jgi:hypothetical protein
VTEDSKAGHVIGTKIQGMIQCNCSASHKLTGIATGGLDEPTITLIIAIVTAIITAAFFIIRLEFRVKYLEKHPFITGIDSVHKQDVIDFYREVRARKEHREE